MSAVSKPRDVLQRVLMGQRFAALATQQNDQPYVNLVAFTASDDLSFMLFATSRNTQKYRNIEENAKVAILIDNRRNAPSDLTGALAITALGSASEVAEDGIDSMVQSHLDRHPLLIDFIRRPDTAIIRAKITDYILARFDRAELIQLDNRS